MSKAPNEFDTTRYHEERRAKADAQIAMAEKKKAEDKAARTAAENAEIAGFQGLPKDGETREQLLARIRLMREQHPPEVKPEGYRSPGMLKTFNEEQEAGRAAVAKAEAEWEMYQAARLKAEAEAEKKSGEAGAGLAPQP
jgi:hypothetical protein